MGMSHQKGFTIVEVSLFLAITGVLIAGLLFAVGGSLNAQRYRDATQSFKSLVQKQYSDMANTQNSRTNGWTCSRTTAGTSATGTQFRGQTDCLLVGKYMRISGDDVAIYNVVATRNSTVNASLTDVMALRSTGNYRLNVSTADVEQVKLDWGTRIAWPAGGSGSRTLRDRSMGMLFIRSPDSGRIYTFTSDTLLSVGSGGVAPNAFDSLLVTGDSIPGQGDQVICILSDGLAPNDTAVYVKAFANAASSIEVQSNEFLKANYSGPGSAPRC